MLRPLTTALLLTASLSAQTSTVGFDGPSAPGPFAFVVPGLANGPVIETSFATFDGGVILLDVLFGNSATSGGNIYATCDTCQLGDGSGLPGAISGTFHETVDAVSLDVINGSTASGGTFTLTAYDALGAVVATDSVFATTMGAGGFVQPLAVSGDGIRSFDVTTGLSFGYSFAIDTVTFHRTEGWADLGDALSGVQGDPALVGAGSPSSGEAISLTIVSGPPSGSATLVVGLTPLNAPFKGGVLVPSPDLLVTGLPLDASGAAVLPAVWPSGIPAGFRVLLQAWMPDAAAPQDLSATNALRITAQ